MAGVYDVRSRHEGRDGFSFGGRMKLYRLYTETYPNLARLVSRYFDGATFMSGRGFWKGKEESTTVIEVIGADSDLQKVYDLAGDIRIRNNQQCVLVTVADVVAHFVDIPAIPPDVVDHAAAIHTAAT